MGSSLVKQSVSRAIKTRGEVCAELWMEREMNWTRVADESEAAMRKFFPQAVSGKEAA
jgi:hypothetical protein